MSGNQCLSIDDEKLYLIKYDYVGAGDQENLADDAHDGKVRRKMAVGEGRSMMHWQRLKVPIQRRSSVTMEEVAKHARDDDCWTVFRGKVYNTTAFFDYHPGGRNYMKMAAGRDGTVLFDKHHAWVNLDFIMDKCLIGPLAGADGVASLPEDENEDDDSDAFDEEARRNARANERVSDDTPQGEMEDMD